MFRKGKSAKLGNKIAAFVLILTAGTIHRIKKISKGVFDLKSIEKQLKEGDLIPESIQRLFRDAEKLSKLSKTEDSSQVMGFKKTELYQTPTLKRIQEWDAYNDNLRVYESYRKFSILARIFRK